MLRAHSRMVALLLVPCFLADPTLATAQNPNWPIIPHPTVVSFETQALFLPLATAVRHPFSGAVQELDRLTSATLAQNHRAKRILIADDNQSILDALIPLLRDEGYEVASVRNGKDAMKAFEENPFDFVISDWTMPGGDGTDFIRQLRKTHPTLSIILMSARSEQEVKAAARELGVEPLTKPFSSIDVLLNKIVQMFAQQQDGLFNVVLGILAVGLGIWIHLHRPFSPISISSKHVALVGLTLLSSVASAMAHRKDDKKKLPHEEDPGITALFEDVSYDLKASASPLSDEKFPIKKTLKSRMATEEWLQTVRHVMEEFKSLPTLRWAYWEIRMLPLLQEPTKSLSDLRKTLRIKKRLIEDTMRGIYGKLVLYAQLVGTHVASEEEFIDKPISLLFLSHTLEKKLARMKISTIRMLVTMPFADLRKKKDPLTRKRLDLHDYAEIKEGLAVHRLSQAS